MAAPLVARLWLALLVGAMAVAANVEKTIFVAGDGPGLGLDHLDGDNTKGAAASSSPLFRLPRLTPDRNAWRTGLPAVFPWADNFPANGTTWVLLDELHRSQRYELRVCWAATQPTDFSVDVFDIATVAATPALAASLATFASGRVSRGDKEHSSDGDDDDDTTASPSTSATTTSSVLRIVAAADFVAADRAAMHPDRVPPVLTDIILDPYLLNVLPRSLLPIVAAILAVAAASAWLARLVILPQLRAVATEGRGVDGGGATNTKTKLQNKDKRR